MTSKTISYAILLCGLALRAGAQPIEIKMATLAPKDSPWCDVLVRMGERWKAISNGNVITVTSGVFANNAATVISNNQWASFISTNGSFYNMRDGVEVDPVDINVGALRAWSATNTVLRSVLAAAPSRSRVDRDPRQSLCYSSPCLRKAR